MKIAYLVLCHKAPEQVEMLIDNLNADNVEFYLHVDAKAKSFTVKDRPNVHVIPEEMRVDIKWGGYSMMLAELSLMRYYLSSARKSDYVALISGQDMPIKTPEEISRFLAVNSGNNFIDIQPHDSAKYIRYTKRNNIDYKPWMFSQSFGVRVLRNLYIYATGGYNRTIPAARRENTTGLEFEFGSQWWVLTYDAMRWVFRYIVTHPQVIGFFKTAMVPDECMVQTVFMNSPYSDRRMDALECIDWTTDRNHPKTYTIEDLPGLTTDGYHLFARKFDIGRDEEIIRELTNSLKSRSAPAVQTVTAVSAETA